MASIRACRSASMWASCKGCRTTDAVETTSAAEIATSAATPKVFSRSSFGRAQKAAHAPFRSAKPPPPPRCMNGDRKMVVERREKARHEAREHEAHGRTHQRRAAAGPASARVPSGQAALPQRRPDRRRGRRGRRPSPQRRLPPARRTRASSRGRSPRLAARRATTRSPTPKGARRQAEWQEPWPRRRPRPLRRGRRRPGTPAQ